MHPTGENILITTAKRTVCYDDHGEGKLPLIFIHGFPFDKSSWQPQMEFLRDRHRVIAYDIRGFGHSMPGDEKFSIVLFADDLIAFMDALEIPKAIVCGLSMGGYILLNAVHRYPERFSALILSDTQCIADTPEAKEKRFKGIKQIEEGGLNEYAASSVKALFSEHSQNTKKEAVEKIRKIILATPPDTITRTLHALAERNETCDILGGITIPTLILCGREDKVTPPPQAEYLHAHIKNSVFHIIDKAGHLSNLENEEEFNKYLQQFISKFR